MESNLNLVTFQRELFDIHFNLTKHKFSAENLNKFSQLFQLREVC